MIRCDRLQGGVMIDQLVDNPGEREQRPSNYDLLFTF